MMNDMQYSNIYIYIILSIVGLCLGSYACATLWRIRAKQLRDEKFDGEKIDEKEYKKLSKLSEVKIINDYSRCLECSYRLKWYDMLPLVSWIVLGGKCRKCKKPIGYLEPLMELGMMLFFVLSFAFWPPITNNIELARFIIWLVSGVGLIILFAYDQLWSILPDQVNYSVIGLGLINTIFVVLSSNDKIGVIINILGAIAILGGLYWSLNYVSKGKWIGFGDVKLGLGLGLLLADWKLAFLALFAANLIGSLIVIPLMLIGKLKRDSRIPFGPLLIFGYFLAGLAGGYVVSTYLYGLV